VDRVTQLMGAPLTQLAKQLTLSQDVRHLLGFVFGCGFDSLCEDNPSASTILLIIIAK